MNYKASNQYTTFSFFWLFKYDRYTRAGDYAYNYNYIQWGRSHIT